MQSSVIFIEKFYNGNTHYQIILSDPEHLNELVVMYVSVTKGGKKVHFIERDIPTQEETEMRAEFEKKGIH